MEEASSEIALSQPWALVAVAACATVVVCALVVSKRVRPSTLLWALPFALVAGFFAVWSARGFCQINPFRFCQYQALYALLGIAVLQRERVHRFFSRILTPLQKPSKHARGDSQFSSTRRIVNTVLIWVRDIALLALAALFSFLALEVADNPDWLQIDTFYFQQGLWLVGLTILALYFLGQRHAFLCVLAVVVCTLFGLAQTFLDLFKNTALLPSDVMAWKTAAAVSGGYTYVLPTLAITSITCATVALAALAFIVPTKMCRMTDARNQSVVGREASVGDAPGTIDSSREVGVPSMGRRIASVMACLVCCALCVGGIWYNVTSVDYQEDLGVKLGYWDLRSSYHKYGFLVSFVAAMQDLVIEVPEGYSDESAAALQESLAKLYDEQFGQERVSSTKKFNQQTPSVIAIMNESYSDLSIFEKLHDDYEGTYVTQKLDDALVSGWLDTSVHGGGTCNTEYEFLAFSSMGFLSSGMYPYQQFSFAHVTTLPSMLKNLGYTTWGMHPSYPGNWSREFVYATMGIDTSLFIYDFWDDEKIRDLVSDRATYDRMLDILSDSDEPQFILDITMQNHGGYDTGKIPADQMTSVKPDFLDEDATVALNEFLTCIKISDEALEYFLGELRQFDKPVAVVFFGDHQPYMSRDFNDALFQDENELDHKARISEVPYFIWTNYDTGSKPSKDVTSSASFLAVQLLEAIGAPLDPYQKALLVLHQQISSVSTNGFCDVDGVWHDASEGAASDHPYHQLQVLHYYNVVRNL